MSYEKREAEFIKSEELKQGLIKDMDKVSLFRLKRKAENPQRFISSFLSNRGLDAKMVEYQFVTHWKEIVGEGVAKHATPHALKNKVLYVNVTSASWMQELSFQKSLILAKLNSFFNSSNKVLDIKFLVK